MNKTDLLILASAGVMTMTAGGLWLSQNDLLAWTGRYVERPLTPSGDMPTFERDSEKAESERAARFAKADAGNGAEERGAVRRAFLSKAGRLLVSPCNSTAKAEYLRALSDYIALKLADIRRSGGERNWETPEDYQVIEYMDRMTQDNFITSGEFRQAMEDATPALALTVAAEEAQSNAPDMPSFGPSACEAYNRGERAEPMPWATQRRANDSQSGR